LISTAKTVQLSSKVFLLSADDTPLRMVHSTFSILEINLVLLCHKRRRRFTELQCGQCPRAVAMATPSCKRSDVIEFAT
jgi:hypothetical protein